MFHPVTPGSTHPTPVINPHAGVSKLALGVDFIIFLMNDGTLYGVGSNLFGQLGLGNLFSQILAVPIPTFSTNRNIVDISVGKQAIGLSGAYVLALTNDGKVYSWGDGASGKLGKGNFASATTPTIITTLPTIKKIYAGADASFVVATDGKVYAFGANQAGQLSVTPVGSPLANKNSPNLVLNIFDPEEISSGGGFTVFLTNGDVWAVGNAEFGKLGFDTLDVLSQIPIKLSSLYQVAQISTGNSYTLALTKFGFVYSFGSFQFSPRYPTLIPVLRNVTRITKNRVGCVMSTNRDEFYGYGLNSAGEIGIGNSGRRSTPQRLNFNPENITLITKGRQESTTFILVGNGTVYGMGSNSYGQLALGFVGLSRLTPVILPLLTGISTVSCHGPFALAIRNSKALSFGFNDKGQLGLNHTTSIGIPTLIPSLTAVDVQQISTGLAFSMVLTNTSEVYTFGSNLLGQLGQNSTQNLWIPTLVPNLNNIIKIMAGEEHAFALDSTGSLYGWGKNSFGTLGLGDMTSRSVPTRMPFSSYVSDVNTGNYIVFITVSNSTIYSTGLNSNSEMGLVADIPGGSQSNYFISTPRQVISITNLDVIEPGFDTTMIINRCNSSWAGYKCHIPTCFGEPAASSLACNGFGVCTAPNTCSCFPPTTGTNCDIAEFHWRGDRSGSWNTPGNWLVSRSGLLVATNNVPAFIGESLVIDQPGTYSLDIPLPKSSKLGYVHIGGTNVFATVTISSGELIISDNLFIYPGSTLNLRSNVFVDGIFTSGGSFTAVDSTINATTIALSTTNTLTSTILNSNLVVNKDSSMILVGCGSGKQIKMTNNGNLEFRGTSSFVSLEIVNQNTLMIVSGAILSSQVLTLNTTETSITQVYGSIKSISQSLTSDLAQSNSMTNTINNKGRFIFDSRSQDVVAEVNINNQGVMIVSGNRTTTLSGITTLSGSTIEIQNSNLSSPNPIVITAGFLSVSGSIQTSNFTLSNPEQPLRLIEPYKLTVLGNFELLPISTLIVTLRGLNLYQSDFFNVTGTLSNQALTLIKKSDNYAPEIGQIVPFLTYGGITSSSFATSQLLGAPYKNVDFIPSVSNRGIASLKIVFSFGSTSNNLYKCHYVGKRKILEMVEFKSQEKMAISFTVPPRDSSWIGFGFDIQGVLNQSLLSVTRGNESFEVLNHVQSFSVLPTQLLDISATTSNTFFAVGSLYRTITLILRKSTLQNQKNIFYSEFTVNNSRSILTNPHYYTEQHAFSILNDETTNCTNFLQPLRVEVYDKAVLGILLVVYAIIFVLCCIFARFRPMNTRGISPHLTLLFLFVQLLLEVRNYDEIPEYQGSLCIYYSYGILPLQQISFIMMLLYFIRYFSIINLNENKKNIYQSIKLGEKLGWTVRFKTISLKILASTWLTILVLILSYLFVILIFTIVLAADKFVCKFTTLVAIRSINNAELIIIYFLILGTLIVDAIPNWRLIFGFKWIQYVFYSDPYWFRAQIILFLPFMIYSLAVEIFALATSTNFLDIVTHFWPAIALNTISYAILLILEVLFPLVITMITLCFTKKKAASKNLGEILSDPQIQQLFLEFCQIEFSLENILCWIDIQKFKKNPDRAYAKELYRSYLEGATSMLEVNIPRRIAQATFEKMNQEDVPIDDKLFETVERDITANLSDTYSRFVHWEKYHQYMKNETTQKELLEGK